MGIKDDFNYIDGMLYRTKSDRRVKAGQQFGCLTPTGYVEGFYKGKKVGLHRLVYEWHFGKFEGIIDHIDGNPSNNRIENLRLANNGENRKNSKVNSNNQLGIKGLSIMGDYYRTKITHNGEVYRKTFPLTSEGKQQAINWLETKRNELHKEFANNGY